MLRRNNSAPGSPADCCPMTAVADPPLTAAMLRRALIVGAQRVIAGRDHLNRINVFPVADGDTGNNLAFTLGGLLNGALVRRSRHVGDLLQAIGDQAIDSARGNSGAILAQFLYAIAEHARDRAVLDPAGLAAAVRHGANQAREALADPVEGTILSVMDRFAEALEVGSGDSTAPPLSEVFASALDAARRALARTPSQMALLERAGVVDAGAQGFVDFLEGIDEYAQGGRPVSMARVAANAPLQSDVHVHGAYEEIDPSRRWCTECLLLGEGLDRDRVGAALAALDADSVVLAGGASRLRVHAHVASPQALFDACAGFGRAASRA